MRTQLARQGTRRQGSPIAAQEPLNYEFAMYSPQNQYIQSADLNGKPFTKTWLTHDTITAGGLLELQMGPKPNQKWGSAASDVPPNYFE
jgi:putative alpha-1,2-mannosidase